jgi:hypothetical protein
VSANEHPVDDINPPKDDVMQVEVIPESEAVPVQVEGPVRVQVLPRKGGSTRTRTISTTPVRLLSADHRRAMATLISIGTNVLFALGKEQAADPTTMALWPQNVPYVVTADTEVWVAAVVGPTQVSITTELWAEGDSRA